MPTEPKSFVRPIDAHWWARKPYRGYTLREATGFAVMAYALVLLAGVMALARGPAAYATWLAFLRTPASLLLHGVLLVAMVVHVWSWFVIMPKTMPRRVRGDRVVAPSSITRLGGSVALLAFVAEMLVFFWSAS
jgi:fumarate reductase subunit C